MRLLFLRFPLESSLGGAEIQTISLMKGLMARGHAVAYAGSCPTLLKLTKEEGIPNVELEIGPPPVSKWHALTFAWRKQKMQQQLEQIFEQFHDLDAIFMLSLSEKILLTPFALKKGIKVFWIEHDRVGPWLSKNPWLGKLQEMSGDVTTIAVSDLSRKMYENLGFHNVIAIPNGIDLQRFDSSTAAADCNRQLRIHIGSVSRLTSDKGIDLLIQAVKDIPQVDLTIVGSGREEGYLRMIIGSDDDRIRIVPRVSDLGAFYRSLDALVLPSREHDPFGLVAAEAMSLGVPVIVTDACGIAGYLRDGADALIVHANDVTELKRGIERLLLEEVRNTLTKHGKETAHVQFSLDSMIGRYDQVLRQ